MAIETIVQKVRLYDNPSHRSISFSTQQIGTGDSAGLVGPLNTLAIVPGSLVDDTYVRTDVTGFEQEIQDIANMCWSDEAHTAYEAFLRG